MDTLSIILIVLALIYFFISPYIEGTPLSMMLTVLLVGLAVINIIDGVLDHLREDIQKEENNQEVVNSDSLKCEPSENEDWICKKIKPVATFDANSKLFIEDGSKEKVKNNSSEEQHVILKERPLPKDNSISLKCTVTEVGTYICTK